MLRNTQTIAETSEAADRLPQSHPLVISVVGRFVVRFGSSEVKLPNRKTRALLACLALQGSETNEIARERLVGLVWSETDENKARASLRQALHELRDAFAAVGFVGLETDKLRVALSGTTLSVDILEAIEDAAQGRVHPALQMQSQPLDDLLGSLESIDPAFQSWVMAKRKTFEDRLLSGFENALKSQELASSAREMLARALINLDPTHEIGVRNLMTARLELGDTAGALQAYKLLWDVLEEEFDTEPSKPTQELFARIKMMEAGVTPPALPIQEGIQRDIAPTVSPLTLSVPISTAVRPLISVAEFDVGGTASEHHYLVQGFRRDLLSCLVRFREWLVRDSAGVTSFINSDTQEYAIEASAYTSDGGIRLAMMLHEKQSGIYLWSERLKLSPETWFDAQQDIVRRLAAVLNLHISSGRLEALALTAETDILAYDVWLRAQSEMNSWEKLGWSNAVSLLRDLVRRHPRFAPAYSHLAQLFNSAQFVQPGLQRTVGLAQEATTLAIEATRLDPVDSRGHLALGWAYAMAGRHDRAAVHHDMAQELNDNDPWTLMSAGLGAASRGEHDKARSLSEKALALSVTPGASQWLYIAQIAFLRGDYEGVIGVDSSAWQGVRYAPGWRIAALGCLGRKAEASIALDQYIERLRTHWANSEEPTRDSAARWFLHVFPFSSQAGWDQLKNGFEMAGADVRDAKFQPVIT
jgi:DNA-binding SARP family transcriptional activator/tetratricopeptide (TPR) repeat protein/TolB-like protein